MPGTKFSEEILTRTPKTLNDQIQTISVNIKRFFYVFVGTS